MARRRSPVARTAVAAPPTPAGTSASTRVWAALALVALTVLAYGPAYRAGFIWDDDDYVTENPTLDSVAGLGRIWLEPGAVPQYYPLTFTSLWLEHQVYGDAPTGYHVDNVLVHALNAVLAWLVLTTLGIPGAWLAAAVFALHPVHVESVAWVTERKNLLSGAGYLAALLAALGFVDATLSSDARRTRAWVVLVGFVAALLSKTVTCSLPVIVLLLLWWKRGRVGSAEVRATLPLFAIGIALALVTIWLERTHVGARGVHWDLSIAQRVLIAGRALWFYAGSLVWPSSLSFVYPRWVVDPSHVGQWLLPVAAAAVALGAWVARDRVGRWPFAALAGFAVTLAPALGFVDVYPMRYTFVADHYQYLASLFLIAPAAALATGAAERWHLAVPLRRAAAALLLATLAILTWNRATLFVDQETLWHDVIAKDPGSSMAWINLGIWLQQHGRTPEAVGAFESALRLEPDDPEVHGNLGIALAMVGRGAEARGHLERALALAPDSAQAHSNLANALAASGELAAAADHYRTATRLNPRFADAENNLANVLVQQGAVDEAIRHYEAALAIDPDYVDANVNLASVLTRLGRNDEAIARYRAALGRDPARADAASGLGAQLAARRQWNEAIGLLGTAARLRPNAVEAQHQLAAALAGADRTDEAIVAYGRALALRPDSADLHNDLGIAFARRGDLDAAAAEFEKAVALAPDHREARGNLEAALAELRKKTPAAPPAARP